MSQINNNIECVTPDYSKFNHSHRVLNTTGIGRLQPVYSRVLLPGETIRADVKGETYFQPLSTAVKQKFDICYHWFAVPCRIISGGKSEKYYLPDPRKMNSMRSNTANKPHINVTFDKLNVPFFDSVSFVQPTKDHKQPFLTRSYKLGRRYHIDQYSNLQSLAPRLVPNMRGNVADLESDDFQEPQFGKGTLADCFGFPARPAIDYSFEKLPEDFLNSSDSPVRLVRLDLFGLASGSDRNNGVGTFGDFIEAMGYDVKRFIYDVYQGKYYKSNLYSVLFHVPNITLHDSTPINEILLGIVFYDEDSNTWVDVTNNFPLQIAGKNKCLLDWCLTQTPSFNSVNTIYKTFKFWDGSTSQSIKVLFPHVGRTEDGLKLGVLGQFYRYLENCQPHDEGVITNVQAVESWKWRAYYSIVDRFYRDRNYSEELPLDEFFAHNGDEDSNLLSNDVYSPSAVNGFVSQNYQKYMHNIEGYPTATNPEDVGGYSRFLCDRFYRTAVRCAEEDEFTAVLPSTISGETGTTAPLSFDEQMLSAQNYLTALTADADHPKNADWLGSDLHIDSNALGLNIEALRNSLRVNQFLKMMHYGGYLPDEQQEMLFSVVNKDYRALRPEYLDGCVNPIVIGDIMNTTLTEYAPLGQLGAIGSNRTHTGITYRADEYTVIMCICSIRPKVYYTGGLSRLDTRLTYMDEFKPQFADLGEQEVYSSEINWVPFNLGSLLQPSSYCEQARNNDAVGYQSRYFEYKYTLDRLCGDFHDSMSYWQCSKQYSPYENVVIDNDFMLVDESLYNDIFAVVDGTDRIYQQLNFDIAIKSPLNMITETKLL